jgi:hypothetical protein
MERFIIGADTVSSFGPTELFKFSRGKELRKASRRKSDAKAWIRLDGGFAIRPCNVNDLSDTGVQITILAAETIPGVFTLLMSRDANFGRRARVKWRRGSQIGAEFI